MAKPLNHDHWSSGLGAIHIGTEYTPQQLEFFKAIEAYQRRTKIRYPTYREILRIAKQLGYTKPPIQLPGQTAATQ